MPQVESAKRVKMPLHWLYSLVLNSQTPHSIFILAYLYRPCPLPLRLRHLDAFPPAQLLKLL